MVYYIHSILFNIYVIVWLGKYFNYCTCGHLITHCFDCYTEINFLYHNMYMCTYLSTNRIGIQPITWSALTCTCSRYIVIAFVVIVVFHDLYLHKVCNIIHALAVYIHVCTCTWTRGMLPHLSPRALSFSLLYMSKYDLFQMICKHCSMNVCTVV